MSEPVGAGTAFCISIASGTLTAAAFSIVGAHALDVMSAFGGCVVAQTLLPNDRKTAKAIAWWAAGSITLSVLATPVAAPWWASHAATLGLSDGADAVRHIGSAVVAMLAQTLALVVQKLGETDFIKWLRRGNS